MKILVHDYAGHPFQAQLSRRLARRGHEVVHAFFADNPGPKGAFQGAGPGAGQPRFVGLTLGGAVSPTALFARRANDISYGKLAARLVRDVRPQVVISGNTPTEAQGVIIGAAKAVDARFVYWIQDVYSVAVSVLLRRRFGLAGALVGRYYRWLDQRQFRRSDALVAISEDFRTLASGWGSRADAVTVIENWGMLDEIQVGPRDNAWSRQHGVGAGFTFLYSGTLGLKHKPELLVSLAQAGHAVVAVGQGVGFKTLEAAAAGGETGIRMLPIQPVEALPEVLASGDVLVAVIETEAGSFAVPSKVQSYLCAGRPILLAAPPENLAARIVAREQAGLVVDPDDAAGFLDAAARLQADPALRARLGANGRAYAERSFDIDRITDRFEAVFRGVSQPG